MNDRAAGEVNEAALEEPSVAVPDHVADGRVDEEVPEDHEEEHGGELHALDEGALLVLYALRHHLGGEIFVPKIPSYRILDVAKAIAPDCKTNIVGIRPGEKLHEEMITSTDSLCTIDIGPYYAILPTVSYKHAEEDYLKHHAGTKVPEGFSYSSGENTDWETVDSLRQKIQAFVNPDL